MQNQFWCSLWINSQLPSDQLMSLLFSHRTSYLVQHYYNFTILPIISIPTCLSQIPHFLPVSLHPTQFSGLFLSLCCHWPFVVTFMCIGLFLLLWNHCELPSCTLDILCLNSINPITGNFSPPPDFPGSFTPTSPSSACQLDCWSLNILFTMLLTMVWIISY